VPDTKGDHPLERELAQARALAPSEEVYCRSCGMPLQYDARLKAYQWSHVDPNSDCTRAEPTPGNQVPPFAGIGTHVMRGAWCVAVATSNTMARRIARALNRHTPNARGY
jgi:hypothetical protein